MFFEVERICTVAVSEHGVLENDENRAQNKKGDGRKFPQLTDGEYELDGTKFQVFSIQGQVGTIAVLIVGGWVWLCIFISGLCFFRFSAIFCKRVKFFHV